MKKKNLFKYLLMFILNERGNISTAGDDTSRGTNPEVVSAVLKEIKSLGTNTKASIDEMGRRYEELKGLIYKNGESLDVCVKNHVNKLTEDISTRQSELDKNITSRVDNLEVALKRTHLSTGNGDENSFGDAKEFLITGLSNKGQLPRTGIIDEKLVNVDEFKAYKSIYPQYLRYGDRVLNSHESKTMQVGVDPDGGYFVQPTMSRRIITKIYESDPIRQLANIEIISGDALELRVDRDEADAGWEGETVAGVETDTPQLDLIRIPAHVLYAKPRVSLKLLEDSSIDIEKWLANKIASKFIRVDGAAFVTGDGINKPRGFATYADGTSWKQIEQIPSLAASTITADGLVNLKYALREEFLSRATFIMNRLTVAVVMTLKNGNGDYIWRPGLEKGQPSLLEGLPVMMSTTMPTVTASALAVALADWQEAYQIVDKLGISILRDPYSSKPAIEFYTRKRVGGDVANFDAIKLMDISAS